MVSIVFGGLVLVLALFFEKIRPDLQADTYDIVKYVGCGLAALMFGAGIFYLVKG